MDKEKRLDIECEILKTIKFMLYTRNEAETRWIVLENSENFVTAVVLGWWCYDTEPMLVGKVAQCPHNSGMQEYEFDWIMPVINEWGDLWDTDTEATADAVGWWLDEYEAMKKEGALKE